MKIVTKSEFWNLATYCKGGGKNSEFLLSCVNQAKIYSMPVTKLGITNNQLKTIKFKIYVLALLSCLFLNLASARKMALVIGNNDYRAEIGRLNNPINDAFDMGAVLAKLGFEVTSLIDVKDDEAFYRAVADFGRRLSPDDIAFFYYSGHGTQINGVNYLVPTQAPIISETVLKNKSVSVNYILEEMQNSDSKVNILVIDACRNFPSLGGSKSLTKGLAEMPKISDSVIAFATAAGQVALEGSWEEGNSPYVASLKLMLENTNLDIEAVFINTRDEVFAFEFSHY